MTADAATHCLFIYACLLGLFVSEVVMLFFVYEKVHAVWLRVVAFMFGGSLFCALPIFAILLGCGLV
jgi:predicted permease